MLQREFFKNVMESNLTEETVEYARERYEKMIDKDQAKVAEHSEIRRKILEVLTVDEKLTAKEVGLAIGVSTPKASYHLCSLAHEGIIAHFVDLGPRGPKQYSALPE